MASIYSNDSIPTDTYLTLGKETSGQYKDRSSRFCFYSFPVENEDQIKKHLQDLRKKHWDARHHCYAWSLGPAGRHFRANDDGEPNHSAGDPILGQVRSNGLTNCLIVVVRYFGGTKLGISGLINAYKTSAAQAIAENEIIEKLITEKIHIFFPYADLNDVMKLIKTYELSIYSQEMNLQCEMILEVRLGLKEQIVESLQGILGLTIKD